MLDPTVLLAAVLLDFAIGDPRKLPHLARWTGRLIQFLEPLFRHLPGKGLLAGSAFALAVVSIALGVGALVLSVSASVSAPLNWILQTLLLYQCIAARDLIQHVERVRLPLLQGQLSQARQQLAWIVGRDTKQLDESEIARATVETTAESFHDGFVGPVFWAVLLGPLGALLFRVVNTLDSMVGHRDKRYLYFGRFSARFDDALGFLPARISAFLLAPKVFLRAFPQLRKQAGRHASPNAGWPEAAIAMECELRLGGGNFYDGQWLDGPVFNAEGSPPDVHSIGQVNRQFWWGWLRTILLALLVAYALNPHF
ncbi:MAG: cobalamin biosynthesis protein CobD [Opitutales bacterium]|nr:cobalamin biosynthesis protein CobD [Opitutales bacterium]